VSGIVALLTDFGLRDGYVGVMKGVMLTRNPGLRLVDLTHDVPPQDVRRGAFVLRTSVAYFPSGTVFLGVVDPGVGTARRAVAIEAGGYRFVGPDNGLFAWALRELSERGLCSIQTRVSQLGLCPPGQAVELTEPSFWQPRPSSTFHGRDIFAPVAAALAGEVPISAVGRPLDWLVDLVWPDVVRGADGSVRGEVVSVDVYGNLVTNLRPRDLPPSPSFTVADEVIDGLAPHFQSGRGLIALVGSSGLVEIAAPNGNAAAALKQGVGALVACPSTRL
jgi:S-adenosylmethionine hydrolase